MAQGCLGGGDRCRFPEQNLVLDGDFSGFDSRPLPGTNTPVTAPQAWLPHPQRTH